MDPTILKFVLAPKASEGEGEGDDESPGEVSCSIHEHSPWGMEAALALWDPGSQSRMWLQGTLRCILVGTSQLHGKSFNQFKEHRVSIKSCGLVGPDMHCAVCCNLANGNDLGKRRGLF